MTSSQLAPPSSRIALTLAKVWRVCSRRVGPAGVGAWPSTAGRKPTWPATWRMFPFRTPCENLAGGVVCVAGVMAVLSVIGTSLCGWGVGGGAGVLAADVLRGAAHLGEQGEEFLGGDD